MKMVFPYDVIIIIFFACCCSCSSTFGFRPTTITTTTRQAIPHGQIMLRRWATVQTSSSPLDQSNKHDYSNEKSPTSRDFATKIITCSSSKELAHAVSTYVQPGHRVAELGSQLREVSTAICESLLQATTTDSSSSQHPRPHQQQDQSSAVLVDVIRKFPKSDEGARTDAMRRATPKGDDEFLPSVATFLEIPQLQDWRRAFFFPDEDERSSSAQMIPPPTAYNVFVLDVNAIVGNDLEWTSLSIIREFEALNHNSKSRSSSSPLVVLVKSMELNQWANRLVHGVKWVNQQGQHEAIPAPHIVATRGVHQYRSTIPYTVRSNDSVLEVGCHFGTSTALLHAAAWDGCCVGVDLGPKIIREANQKHPGVFFRVGNAWRTAELLRIQQEYYRENPSNKDEQQQRRIGFDVVYVDVGGLSGSDGLLEAISLISSIRYALEPRCIVIKSLCMQRLSSALVPYWQIQKQQQKSQAANPPE
jgi:hypothetical protein